MTKNLFQNNEKIDELIKENIALINHVDELQHEIFNLQIQLNQTTGELENSKNFDIRYALPSSILKGLWQRIFRKR